MNNAETVYKKEGIKHTKNLCLMLKQELIKYFEILGHDIHQLKEHDWDSFFYRQRKYSKDIVIQIWGIPWVGNKNDKL